MSAHDDSSALLDKVSEAVAAKASLTITGGNSKAHLGNHNDRPAHRLDMQTHRGIIEYDPTELVVTVRAGTPLAELEHSLREAGQMLPFEPPAHTECTIGGILACGLSGPRRPFSGSARDYVLGTRIINGHAQDLSFGGQVMKNVAGYDVSRVQVGAWGTLGVLLDVSMKVLPRPELELTLKQQSEPQDTAAFSPFMRMPLPLSGAMLVDEHRYLRLSGSEAAVRAAAQQLGGDILEENSIWESVRDHTHAFFRQSENEQSHTLWRISVADYAPALSLSGRWLYEWGGAQRWLMSTESAEKIYAVTQAAEGHAMRYGSGPEDEAAFQPLSGAMQSLQKRVRDSFDPLRLFNRGRFHAELDGSTPLATTDA